jgi:hypothetical protein
MNDHSDPVNNPWVGLKMHGKGGFRKVTELKPNVVWFVPVSANGRTLGMERCPWQSQWSKWAAGAVVVK